MATAREIDRVEQEYVRRGSAFFHAAGSGHEGSAALAPHLTDADWLHCHYRDKALLLARGISIREFFLSLMCKADSNSAGRQMCPHLSARDLNVLSIVGPVGNNALQAVGVAAELRARGGRGIVVCSVGDGTTQQGEFLEAVAHAVREQLPVLFLIEDNRWSISTPTVGRTFFSRPDGPARDFYGLPIDRIDGRDPLAACHAFGQIVSRMRTSERPSLVWMAVERLADHSNADDQMVYRDGAEVAKAQREADPLMNLRSRLLVMGVDRAELEIIEKTIIAEVAAVAAAAAECRDPEPVFTARRGLPNIAEQNACQTDGARAGAELTMGAALRATLRHHLQTDDRVTLFGEDVEDPKGDVFGVTRGLSSDFPGRVRNSPLSESTIVGVSIGRALAGGRPVAFLQFADFLPLAFNQIAAELGSIFWRTNGAWESPVIVMVSCGGYRPGLGPFHSQTLESLAAHLPGIDVVMPSTAGDAAGLLNAAFASGRPTLFFYPKSCLNLPERATPVDIERQFVPLGTARTVRRGNDLTFVSWGYPALLCEKAAEALAAAGIESDMIDLRSLSPWDETRILESAERTGRLIVVHEDNHTCGFGAEIIATVAEKARRSVACRRIARPDTFVPCHFPSQLEVLPSFRRVLGAAAELVGFELAWENDPEAAAGCFTIDAVGSGPADAAVVITEVLVAPGKRVAVGDVVATAEAEKSIVEISSNGAGVVEEVLVTVGERVAVGRPLVRIVSASAKPGKTIVQEQYGRPILRRTGQTPLPVRRPAVHGPESDSAEAAGAPSTAGPAGDATRSTVPGAQASGPVCEASFRDVPLSPRQRLLNQRMSRSLQTVPQGTIMCSAPADDVASATARLRSRYTGLAISEFDVLSFCAARASVDSPGLRSALIGEATKREYARLNLGIAVHLDGDELATAVVRGADVLPFEQFLAASHAQIQMAQEGGDQAAPDTQLLITHLGRLPVTNATPILVAPAAAVLFIGSATRTGAGAGVNLTLGFDHRLLNGMAAARFVDNIRRQIAELGESGASRETEGTLRQSVHSTRGTLRQLLEVTPPERRGDVAQDQVGRLVAGLVHCDVSELDARAALRNQGLDSLSAAELALTLGNLLDMNVPATLVWNHSTVESISTHLLERLGMRLALQAPACHGVTASERLLFEIERLSDGDVQALLDVLPAHP